MTKTAPLSMADDRREKLRSKILGSALTLFAERGYHGTTIPSVMERAGVGAGSLYRLFESKEVLVNAVFRDQKRKLERALRDRLDLDLPPRALFDAFWARLTGFARAEPIALRFLELQDHVPYLDGESRALELTVLGPILVVCAQLQQREILHAGLRPDTMIALVWGAFVGLIKAERLGYLTLDDPTFTSARDGCWRALAREGA